MQLHEPSPPAAAYDIVSFSEWPEYKDLYGFEVVEVRYPVFDDRFERPAIVRPMVVVRKKERT